MKMNDKMEEAEIPEQLEMERTAFEEKLKLEHKR